MKTRPFGYKFNKDPYEELKYDIYLFYSSIKEKYQELTDELMQKDCQRVEFIRGMLSAYKQIIEENSNYADLKPNNIHEVSPFK